MQCTIDNCGKEATHTFVWPWGAEGACCQDHVLVVQQKAKSARGKFGQVSFSRLDPDRPKEMRRDERIELHAARLTAEGERDDARLRASKLFEENTKLSNELRALRVRTLHLEAEVKLLASNAEAAVRERDAALVKVDLARENNADLAGLHEERNSLLYQVQGLTAERDGAQRARDVALLELDSLKKQMQVAASVRVQKERDEALSREAALKVRVVELTDELTKLREALRRGSDTPTEGVQPIPGLQKVE